MLLRLFSIHIYQEDKQKEAQGNTSWFVLLVLYNALWTKYSEICNRSRIIQPRKIRPLGLVVEIIKKAFVTVKIM